MNSKNNCQIKKGLIHFSNLSLASFRHTNDVSVRSLDRDKQFLPFSHSQYAIVHTQSSAVRTLTMHNLNLHFSFLNNTSQFIVPVQLFRIGPESVRQIKDVLQLQRVTKCESLKSNEKKYTYKIKYIIFISWYELELESIWNVHYFMSNSQYDVLIRMA